jgi:hypothetical protein
MLKTSLLKIPFERWDRTLEQQLLKSWVCSNQWDAVCAAFAKRGIENMPLTPDLAKALAGAVEHLLQQYKGDCARVCDELALVEQFNSTINLKDGSSFACFSIVAEHVTLAARPVLCLLASELLARPGHASPFTGKERTAMGSGSETELKACISTAPVFIRALMKWELEDHLLAVCEGLMSNGSGWDVVADLGPLLIALGELVSRHPKLMELGRHCAQQLQRDIAAAAQHYAELTCDCTAYCRGVQRWLERCSSYSYTLSISKRARAHVKTACQDLVKARKVSIEEVPCALVISRLMSHKRIATVHTRAKTELLHTLEELIAPEALSEDLQPEHATLGKRSRARAEETGGKRWRTSEPTLVIDLT